MDLCNKHTALLLSLSTRNKQIILPKGIFNHFILFEAIISSFYAVFAVSCIMYGLCVMTTFFSFVESYCPSLAIYGYLLIF